MGEGREGETVWEERDGEDGGDESGEDGGERGGREGREGESEEGDEEGEGGGGGFGIDRDRGECSGEKRIVVAWEEVVEEISGYLVVDCEESVEDFEMGNCVSRSTIKSANKYQ
jgi:hypothetical protein